MRATPKTSSPVQKTVSHGRASSSMVPPNFRHQHTIADRGAQGDVLLGGSDLLGGHFGGFGDVWFLGVGNAESLAFGRKYRGGLGFGGGLVAGGSGRWGTAEKGRSRKILAVGGKK